jgi:hypothetical protein
LCNLFESPGCFTIQNTPSRMESHLLFLFSSIQFSLWDSILSHLSSKQYFPYWKFSAWSFLRSISKNKWTPKFWNIPSSIFNLELTRFESQIKLFYQLRINKTKREGLNSPSFKKVKKATKLWIFVPMDEEQQFSVSYLLSFFFFFSSNGWWKKNPFEFILRRRQN